MGGKRPVIAPYPWYVVSYLLKNNQGVLLDKFTLHEQYELYCSLQNETQIQYDDNGKTKSDFKWFYK